MGAAGPYKFTANEVAIGLTMPLAAIEILRQRLAPAHFNRAVILAETFAPEAASRSRDSSIAWLSRPSCNRSLGRRRSRCRRWTCARTRATKLRARAHTLEAIRAGIDADYAALRRPALSFP